VRRAALSRGRGWKNKTITNTGVAQGRDLAVIRARRAAFPSGSLAGARVRALASGLADEEERNGGRRPSSIEAEKERERERAGAPYNIGKRAEAARLDDNIGDRSRENRGRTRAKVPLLG